jgi:predicted RNA-binding Zn-ribbon protein involved in translation (DUF1610 family)
MRGRVATMVEREQARALLASAHCRGDFKRLGAQLDAEGTAELRRALVLEGRARGAELPDEAADWPGKRLLRLALAREAASRVVGTPTRLDEPFRCVHCGYEVPAHGRTARNHCPRCLRSLHVDVVPGDRAADCGGILEPVGLMLRAGEAVIQFRCRRCGAERVNRALRDGEVPDDAEMLRRISRGEAV